MNMKLYKLFEEYSRERVITQFYKLFDKYKNEIEEEFDDIQEFLHFLEDNVDPQQGSENINTVLFWLSRGVIDFDDIINGIKFPVHNDTEYQTFTLYNLFLIHSSLKQTLPPELKDLRKIKNRISLLEAISHIFELWKTKEEQQKDVAKGEGAQIYTGKNGTRFYESYDTKHACYIGKGSLWCTATTKSRNYYEYFRFAGYRVITMIPKNPDSFGREKYQFNLFSYIEAGLTTPIYPQIVVFNYVNNPVNIGTLRTEIFEDFIEFLFKQFKYELQAKIEQEGVDDSLEQFYNESLHKMINYDSRTTLLSIQKLITFAKDSKVSFSDNLIEKFKIWCMNQNNYKNTFTKVKSDLSILGTCYYILLRIEDLDYDSIPKIKKLAPDPTLHSAMAYAITYNDLASFLQILNDALMTDAKLWDKTGIWKEVLDDIIRIQ